MSQVLPIIDPAVEARNRAFRADVLRGLRQPIKELPSKYFYDERGSQLFDEICELDEYYPTRTELAIMRKYAGEMADGLGRRCLLIEFGSGSSTKTRLLLDHLQDPAGYVPIDVSCQHLEQTARALDKHYLDLEVLPVCGDFTKILGLPQTNKPVRRRVVYFPGSTVGNFTPPETVTLLRHIASLCRDDGGLLIGVDLKKDVKILERAYNDSKGVTAEFNLNILRRINRELGANFRLNQFRHQAIYNEEQGRIEMHLVSLVPQTVKIDSSRISFAEGETIRTEYSYKYTIDEFRALSETAGWELRRVWTDKQNQFSVQYLHLS